MDTNERVIIGLFAVAYLAVCVMAVRVIGSSDSQSDAITASATLVGVLIGLGGGYVLETRRQNIQEEKERQLRWEASELAIMDEFQMEGAKAIAATGRAQAMLESIETAKSRESAERFGDQWKIEY